MAEKTPIPIDDLDHDMMTEAYTKMQSKRQTAEIHAAEFQKWRNNVERYFNRMATTAGIDPKEYALNLKTRQFEPLPEVRDPEKVVSPTEILIDEVSFKETDK